MIYRTYLDKICTINKDSDFNSGINPIAELMYGEKTSRVLVHFDHNKIKELINDKVFADTKKIKHILHLTNAGSIDFTDVHCGRVVDLADGRMRRAASFDLIFFLIPECWDGGKGFNLYKIDKSKGDFIYRIKDNSWSDQNRRLISTDGCNWYQSKNGKKWNEPGIYSIDTLNDEYDNFDTESGSTVIIGRQHFDVGNENINLDVTEIVNKYITGELENYGIGIAYTPMTEKNNEDKKFIYYSTFFTHKTNTFFEPYLETIYDDYISDDRGTFALKKHNRLYLYSNVGGKATNLDEMPICTIDNVEYNVVQQTKGVYYAEVDGDENVFKPNTMYVDLWKNIKYLGIDMGEVEMDFVVHKASSYFNFGNTLDESTHFSPTIYGIREGEEIKRGDLRKLTVIARENYSKNKVNVVDDMDYRVYIKDGTRQLDVLCGKVNRTVKENFFLIDTSILIPQRYYIDIKFRYNMEEIEHHEILKFDIVSDINNKYN